MDYQIVRSSRKTISLQITPEGKLLVRCPNRMRQAEIQAFVESKRSWIEKHLPKADAPKLPILTAEELQNLADRAREDLTGRTAHYAAQMGITYGRITIRSQRTRWGSCSGRGNLNFNCLLMLCPEEVRDYVVVHELCHRKQMNHSALFWGEVERVLPDYRGPRTWLKENGNALIRRLP